MSKDNKTIFIIDSSQLSDWDFCHYKYKIRYKDYLLPISKERPLDRGTVLHEMMRIYYWLKKVGGVPINKNIEACIKKGRLLVARDSDLSAEDVALLFSTFRQYAEYYANENWIPKVIEKPFVQLAYEDEDFQFIVQGKIDLIVQVPGMAGLVIVDHKTRSRIKTETGLDHQKMFYTKFLNISSFIINKIAFYKTKPPEEKFRREVISYTAEQTEEWYQEFIMTIKEMIAYEKIQFYKRNPTSCDKWGGCVYKQWCNTPASMRKRLIGMTYKIGTEWDVSKHLQDARHSEEE